VADIRTESAGEMSATALILTALALGAVVVLTFVGLVLLAWITKGAEHLGWLLSIWA